MLSDTTLAYAEELTTALLGVDALYRAESGDGDGIVVLNMSTTHQPLAFGSYDDARACFVELERRAASLPEPDRQLYYAQACQSTLAVISWRRGDLPFTGQIADFLHVPAAPASDDELDMLRSEMRTLLGRMGYSGDLAAQCAAWEERNRVPADEVQGVLDMLLDQAWDRTVERMEIPAPRCDGMRVTTVTGAPFNARCNYLGRQVELNIDPILTRPALKHLAVHECYPGHYVQFKLRETWYREGSAPADGLLSVVNTASSCTFEGIADNGLRVLDWIEGDDDRFSGLMTRYRSGIGTAAAWRLHELAWPAAQVERWLRAQSLVGGEGWVANRMRFIAAPQRCALIWSYWWGEQAVVPAWEHVDPARRADFLRFLYGRMHSPQSVAMFE
ncbi:MAG: hypothetical protein ABIV47_23205 [Roseiflexaceae bacterium]